MDYTLERPTHKHVPQIAEIWEAGWHEAHAEIVPPDLRRLRTSESFLERAEVYLPSTRIAQTGHEVLGLSMTKEDELYQMYVSPRARGSGVARALIKDAECRIRDSGHSTAWLACAVGNERAKRFYEKSGWVDKGCHSVELETTEGPFPLQVWRFEKRLEPGKVKVR